MRSYTIGGDETSLNFWQEERYLHFCYAVIFICSWPGIMPVGFAQPGEPLQGYSLTTIATGGSKLEV